MNRIEHHDGNPFYSGFGKVFGGCAGMSAFAITVLMGMFLVCAGCIAFQKPAQPISTYATPTERTGR